MRIKSIQLVFGLLAGFVAGCGAASAPPVGGVAGAGGEPPLTPGQTEFSSESPGGAVPGGGRQSGNGTAEGAPTSAKDASGSSPTPGAPMGRNAAVEEADIYRVDHNRLFYLNTYRGFVIYDLADPKKPARLARLPIYGYPVEMFVSGNTVYALLRDVLYLTQKDGQLRFDRHNTSQLVAIDVTDPSAPKILKTVDIVGELREGVSRKIENSIYVVSSIPQSYWYGWAPPNAKPQPEQAWVYSFDVTSAANPQLIQKLKLFEGGSVQVNDPKTGASFSRSFGGVAISATSNTLMVVENWYLSAYAPGVSGDGKSAGSAPVATGGSSCGSWDSNQQAVVSIVDVSNPSGAIRVHARFETTGQLGDQFKQTYRYDAATKQATYYGIFARQTWSSAGCAGTSQIRNTIESWDVTDGARPVKLDALDFGKPDETVRGSAFDLDRRVAYAITARNIDPLYVIGLDDPRDLRVLSSIDGLSGDMTLFRLVEGGKFLMGIGRDTSETCAGLQDGMGRISAKIAVSMIDVRNLDSIRLMQRQCVAVENADWVGSAISWDLDQAHKMIGMQSDGRANVITIPVSYSSSSQENGWWWYQHQTAVGLMSWDTTRYDAVKAPAQQDVIRNHGTVVHPKGEVRRSIVFTHEGATPRRMMVNLSDTHVSVADIEDLARPVVQSVIEVAPYDAAVYRYGDYVVEQVDDSAQGWNAMGRSEFRVKLAGGELETTATVASFFVPQAQRVLKHGNLLLVFRSKAADAGASGKAGGLAPDFQQGTELVVFDLSTPTTPRQLSRTALPQRFGVPYYRYWCGTGYFGGFWFDSAYDWTDTAAGIVAFGWDYGAQTPKGVLSLLDLRDPAQPKIIQQPLELPANSTVTGIVPDSADPLSFHLGMRTVTGTVKRGDDTLTQYKDFAVRWEIAPAALVVRESINVPGRLVRAWSTGAAASPTRLFLAQDERYWTEKTADNQTAWRTEMRLNLLRRVTVAGKPVAELLAQHQFTDANMSDLVFDGDKLFVNARKGWGYYYGGYGGGPAIDVARPGGSSPVAFATVGDAAVPDTSDQLSIFDLSGLKLTQLYGASIGTYGVQLMGVHDGNLFVNLPGDGVLMVDVADPAQPVGRRFMRTLGWSSTIEFAGGSAYVASGHFGVYRMDLSNPGELASE